MRSPWYKVQHVIDEAVARLEYCFPTTFQPDRLDFGCYLEASTESPVTFATLGDAIGVAALARAIDFDNPPPFLVMALYHCTAFDASSLLDPEVYNDGDEARLTNKDLRICLDAEHRLLGYGGLIMSAVASAVEKPLCDSPTCRSSVQRLLCERVRDSFAMLAEPLRACSKILSDHAQQHPDKRICETCSAELLEDMEVARRIAFQHLDDVFSISTWPAREEI
ncbi:hypothetical protein PsYK624_160220 [Phanerochaete sordida]|uniref:Uncharacterized protein n=1 Tax=Phanerochaete sordida TaxID=48140 RepID=A0A9P3GS09_9APHY|nr:hypothetical protein PsYK624_160220 [Phanerochaete sordida]